MPPKHAREQPQLNDIGEEGADVEFPELQYPVDGLYAAMAMPGYDSFNTTSLYRESFQNQPHKRPTRVPNNTNVHTPFSEEPWKTGNSNYRGTYPLHARYELPPKRGLLEERARTFELIKKGPFTQTSEYRGNFHDTKKHLSDAPPPITSVGAAHKSEIPGPAQLRLPFTETSLHRASFQPAPKDFTRPTRRNPDLEKDLERMKQRSTYEFFDMEQTSTNRGDFNPGDARAASSELIELKGRITASPKRKRDARPPVGKTAGRALKRDTTFSICGGPALEPMRSVSQVSYRKVKYHGKGKM